MRSQHRKIRHPGRRVKRMKQAYPGVPEPMRIHPWQISGRPKNTRFSRYAGAKDRDGYVIQEICDKAPYRLVTQEAPRSSKWSVYVVVPGGKKRTARGLRLQKDARRVAEKWYLHGIIDITKAPWSKVTPARLVFG
jgi:hypothetical protein